MNTKMKTDSQLLIFEPKTETKNPTKQTTKQTTKTGTESQKWRSHGGLAVGEVERRGKGTENKQHK